MSEWLNTQSKTKKKYMQEQQKKHSTTPAKAKERNTKNEWVVAQLFVMSPFLFIHDPIFVAPSLGF